MIRKRSRKMLSYALMPSDKYTWSGGYFGAMKTRVSRALGVAEALKSKYEELENLV